MGRIIFRMVCALLLVGAIGVGATMCSKYDDVDLNDGTADITEQTKISNHHISVESKGERTLHKGDISFFSAGYGKFATGLPVTEMNFDCGKKFISNSTYSLSKEMPSEEDYDKVCEDCFHSEQ